ncbi:MAG TPA: secretion system protein [Clostridiales bacterium UBA8960]|nr:secretion system protein [Clostridiales bacterium UBA8960]
MIYLISGLFFISLLMFLFGAMRMMTGKENVIDKLAHYDEDYNVTSDRKFGPVEKKGPIQRIAKAMERMPSSEKKRKRNLMQIKQADIPLTYEEIFVVKIMGATSLSFLTFALSRNIVLTLLVLGFIWLLPKLLISSRIKKRVKEFDEQLNEGLVMISNALKAGYSFLQALAVAADETQDPFSKEFKGLLKELSLGIPLEDGLSNLMERMPSEDLKLIVNAILIQKDVGGNLSEILENIGETIRERQRIKNEINTLTAQGRLSGMIIMAMPVVLGLMIYVFSPDYIMELFNTLLGRIMLVVAFISQILGWIFIRKIVNIDF